MSFLTLGKAKVFLTSLVFTSLLLPGLAGASAFKAAGEGAKLLFDSTNIGKAAKDVFGLAGDDVKAHARNMKAIGTILIKNQNDSSNKNDIIAALEYLMKNISENDLKYTGDEAKFKELQELFYSEKSLNKAQLSRLMDLTAHFAQNYTKVNAGYFPNCSVCASSHFKAYKYGYLDIQKWPASFKDSLKSANEKTLPEQMREIETFMKDQGLENFSFQTSELFRNNSQRVFSFYVAMTLHQKTLVKGADLSNASEVLYASKVFKEILAINNVVNKQAGKADFFHGFSAETMVHNYMESLAKAASDKVEETPQELLESLNRSLSTLRKKMEANPVGYATPTNVRNGFKETLIELSDDGSGTRKLTPEKADDLLNKCRFFD
ncbi:MAG: hypothetical protein ACPGJV_08550 [Bacteriovoracaceae bacterium]